MSGEETYFNQASMKIGRLAKSLPEQVAASLLTAIQDGAIAPGERLKEETYAERFAVSRSTLREALAQLERRGVVERVPRYGVRVVAVDAEEIEEIFQIRAQLLGLAARLAVEHAPSGFAQQFATRAEQLRRLADAPDTEPSDYARVSIDTQQMLLAVCPGKRLRDIYEGLSEQALWRYAIREKSVSFRTQSRRQASAADWATLSQAITQGDADAAERAAKAVLHASYRAVAAGMAASETGQDATTRPER